jgi:DnaJ-class molecular chaperone
MEYIKSLAVEAVEALGLDEVEEINPTRILTQFLYGGNRKDEERLRYKNNLFLYLMKQHQINDLQLHVKNKCPDCNGHGFEFQSIFSIEEINCPDCKGTGWKISDCLRCNGTGKIGDIPCYTCKGRGTYLFKKTNRYAGIKCLKCQGSGKIKKLIQNLKDVKDIKICNSCNGVGVLTENEISNPVLEKHIGIELLKILTNNENQL